MMTENHFDLLVIGAGSGGVRAARMAAAQGVKVAIIESQYLGGTCVNVGCIPKKLFVYASHFVEEFANAKGFGWQVGECQHQWQTLIDNKDKEIARLNNIYQSLLESQGVEIIYGRATFIAAKKISVANHVYSADKILIAVGGYPSPLTFPGANLAINSDQVFALSELPKRIVIIGGGYISVEFAGIFNQLGVETHLVYRGEQLLKSFDHSSATFLANEMQKKGVQIHYQTEIQKIDKKEQSLVCQLSSDTVLEVDHVLIAAGRTPNTDKLGLALTQVESNQQGFIDVNSNFETKEQGVFALGDVIGTPELTPVALAQAMAFVNQQFGDNIQKMNYKAIPTAIFSQPNMACVGLTEEQVKAASLAVDVFISEFRHLKHTLSGSDERVYMKLLVERKTDKLIGMHMVGPDAGEIIQGFAVAVKAGLTKADVDSTLGIHPTAAEEFVTMRESRYSL